MNCVLYARVSTDRQADKDLSIPAQLQLMRDFAQRQQWTVVEEFIEPGETATTMANRPVLQAMLRRIQGGELKVETVVSHKLNRMARNLDDYIPLRAQLAKHGVRLTYVVEKIDETPSGRLLENIMASIAQFESANLSEETKKGMRQRVLTGGWPHRAPRGYVTVRRTDMPNRGSTCEIHPREGLLIVRAFELFATGRVSVESVAKSLAGQGLQSASGKPLSHSYLHKVLTNPFYCGRIRWKDLDVEGQHQPLIDRSLFERVQAVIRERYIQPRRARATAGFPLKGIARCARCRGHMTAERHGRFGYYRCSRKANRSDTCDARYCRSERAHKDIVGVLRTIQLSRDKADAIASKATSLLQKRITMGDRKRQELGHKLSEIVRTEGLLTGAFLSGHVSPARHQEQSHALQEERRRIERQIKALDMPQAALQVGIRRILDLSTSLRDLYEQMAESRRAELLTAVFTAVIIGADGIVGFTLRPPLDALQGHRSLATQAEALLQTEEDSEILKAV